MRRSSSFPWLRQFAVRPTICVATPVAAGPVLTRTAGALNSRFVSFFHQTQFGRRRWLPGHNGGQP